MNRSTLYLMISILLIFTLTGCAVAPTPAPAPTPEMQASPEFNGYYTLQTSFLEEENQCLEGNRVADDATLGGAAFMNDCSEPSMGQLWKLIPAEDGYYTLHTMFLEEENLCLEGNRLADDSTLGGAAFMDDCTSPATGQLWKLVPVEDGYYTLQTKFLEEENLCLEGNRFAEDSTLGGAAFMNDCTSPALGQLWKLVPVQ